MAKRTVGRKISAEMFTQRQIARFWRNVSTGPGCWLWTGRRKQKATGSARGAFSAGARHMDASRVAYAIQFGAVPAGVQVCHRCDTPLCMRGDHLFLGTQSDNLSDMRLKGRHRVLKKLPRTADEWRGRLLSALPSSPMSLRGLLSAREIEYLAAVAGTYGYESRSMNRLAAQQGISRERVRQIVTRAAGKLGLEKIVIDKRQDAA